MGRRSLQIVLLALGACLGAFASTSGEAQTVATTIALSGQVQCCQAEGPWYASWPDQRNRLQDHVRTGADSVATLEFDVGGRLGINSQTEVVLLGPREAQTVNQGTLQRLYLQAGSIWARISGQGQELQVQTSGGVMGIKGTEFVVETDAEEETSLTVLEGSVELRTDMGETVLVTPGERVRFHRRRALRRERFSDLVALRRSTEGRFRRYREFLGPLLRSTGVRHVPLAARLDRLVADPRAEAARAARRPGTRRPPLDFPADLAPDRVDLAAVRPVFRWTGVGGATQYGLVLAQRQAPREPVWTGRCTSTELAYPLEARPLDPGVYLWWVVPLDAAGKRVGRPSQGSFRSAGWSASGD